MLLGGKTGAILKNNFKEHQITTARSSTTKSLRLKNNFKEHQITTRMDCSHLYRILKNNFKEHQITTSICYCGYATY